MVKVGLVVGVAVEVPVIVGVNVAVGVNVGVADWVGVGVGKVGEGGMDGTGEKRGEAVGVRVTKAGDVRVGVARRRGARRTAINPVQ